MKLWLWLLTVAWLRGLSVAHADPSEASPSLVDPVAAQPVVSESLPNFEVISRHVETIIEEEPAPLPDMQPVRKMVTSIVEIVADPHLPEPPPAPSPADPNDPVVLARLEALRLRAKKTEFVFVSATVYDHGHTLLKWRANGKPENKMTAWSRLDFNHFSGLGKYSYNDRIYSFMMSVTNESQANRQRLAARRNRPYVPVQIPEIPSEGPGFVIVSGDQTDAALMDVVTGLHELYRVEGQRMADAYVAREAARKVHEAELRANPPQPEDVHIRIWKDEEPKITTTPNP